MSEPTQTCQLCGRVEVVRRDGRGFPPDAAKRRLKKSCAATGCPSKPQYLAGLGFARPAPDRPEIDDAGDSLSDDDHATSEFIAAYDRPDRDDSDLAPDQPTPAEEEK